MADMKDGEHDAPRATDNERLNGRAAAFALSGCAALAASSAGLQMISAQEATAADLHRI
jgi:hypothetical protein